MNPLDAVRLAAFPLAYGLTGALIGGTLNRVMIADLNVSATVVATVFAIPLLLAPARVWFGHRSDSHAVGGRRRVPYLLAGAVTAVVGLLAIVQTTVRLPASGAVLAAVLAAAFLVYGLGRALAHNSFQALVADRFETVARGRALTAYEVSTLLGLVVGAGALGSALERYDPDRLVMVSLGVAVTVLGLTLFAAVGQERPSAASTVTDPQAGDPPSEPLGQVVRDYVIADPQARRFFLVVVLTFVGTLAQDVLLEPFAAQVLGMSLGDTTRLTAFWGLGVLAAMLLSITVLLRVLGQARLLRLGISLSAVFFVGLIGVALAGNPAPLRPLVALLGLGTGLAAAGLLAGVAAFTTPARAGLLLGVWAVANMFGHALGSILGGLVVDGVRAISGSATAAYVSVFALEIVALAGALVVLRRVDIGQSHAIRELGDHPWDSPSPALAGVDEQGDRAGHLWRGER
ncbi:MAG: BCD family MFS transporter [Candidatus Phosphoribacter sp.]